MQHEISFNTGRRKRRAEELEELVTKKPKKTRVYQRQESALGASILQALSGLLAQRHQIPYTPPLSVMEENKDYVFLLKENDQHFFTWQCAELPCGTDSNAIATKFLTPEGLQNCLAETLGTREMVDVILLEIELEMTLRRKEGMVFLHCLDSIDFDKNINYKNIESIMKLISQSKKKKIIY